jgi:hypothetical protein
MDPTWLPFRNPYEMLELEPFLTEALHQLELNSTRLHCVDLLWQAREVKCDGDERLFFSFLLPLFSSSQTTRLLSLAPISASQFGEFALWVSLARCPLAETRRRLGKKNCQGPALALVPLSRPPNRGVDVERQEELAERTRMQSSRRERDAELWLGGKPLQL